MAAVRFSEDELGALVWGEWSSQISHEAKALYMLVIRPSMDFATGLAGRKTVISYQKISEALEFDPPAGSKREARRFNKERIRALLKELVRAGLIEWLKTPDRGLAFQCLLADTDQCVSQGSNPGTTPEQPQSSTPEEHPGNNPEESPQVAAFGKSEQPQEHPQEEPGNNPEGIQEEQPASGSPVSGKQAPPAVPPKGDDKTSAGKSKGGTDRITFENLPQGVTQQAANEWVKHRRKMKRPPTQVALDRAMTKAARAGEKLGISPDEAIYTAIEAGWQGLEVEWIINRLQTPTKGGKVVRTGFGQQDFGQTGGKF